MRFVRCSTSLPLASSLLRSSRLDDDIDFLFFVSRLSGDSLVLGDSLLVGRSRLLSCSGDEDRRRLLGEDFLAELLSNPLLDDDTSVFRESPRIGD